MNSIPFPASDALNIRFSPGLAPVRGQSTAASLPGALLPYVQVALPQGTQCWLEWRHMGIGASDAPTVMGENPFRSAADLLAEKLGAIRPSITNHRMAMGIALEPEAREVYCHEANLEMEPVCIQSTRYPWLRASLDGLAKDGSRVIEIKCGRSAYWRTVASGRPPGYYHGQLQHILAITGLPAIDFVCHFPPALPICITVPRDEPYIEQLIDTEKRFWQRIVQERDEAGSRKAGVICSGGTIAA